MNLSTKLSQLSGIGPSFSQRLERLEIITLEDLINYYPYRYDDFSKNTPISEAKVGETVTICGEVWSIKNIYTRFGKVLTKALINDGTGSLEAVWFNQSYLAKSIIAGEKIFLSGKVQDYHGKTSLVAPDWEKITPDRPDTIHTGRLVPVYSETYGLSSKWIRQKINHILPIVLASLEDYLPEKVKGELLPLSQAITQIHFPENEEQLKLAKERLSFDELFLIQLRSQKTKLEWQKNKLASSLKINPHDLQEFINKLPFKLTNSQQKVISEIVQDIQKNHPMNRLLQGDVGSGKTVVAAAIAYLVFKNKLKTILMAPTEILAFQHFATLEKFLGPFGIKIGIYTGSKKFNKKVSGAIPDVIVGTHALLSDKLTIEDVGLVVVDEQQRFGVEQRSLLRSKSKLTHFLTMTATPIPRTVALTLYGDLDLSVIDELPLGRKLIETHFVPQSKRADAYCFIAQKISLGQQAFIITPLIEESETLSSVKAAKVEHERLQKQVFPNIKLGLLHGRLKSKEKEQVINEFKDGKTNILVSTSVVEVGMDIANATIMVIEGAERFGLAQLHQLRGRVGRSVQQSFAFLFTEVEEPSVINRLKQFERIYDGLKLAELDLKIRGSGEVFGIAQSGRWNLKIASLSDLAMIEKARVAADHILKESLSLDKYPKLAAKLQQLASQVMPD